MKAFAIAASLASAASAAGAVQASKVCVSNMGGYDLNWWMEDLLTGNESNNSGNYPIDKMRCADIEIEGLQEGDFLEVMVHAVLGVTKAANTAVIYRSDPPTTVTYSCNGTTLNFSCTLNGTFVYPSAEEVSLQ